MPVTRRDFLASNAAALFAATLSVPALAASKKAAPSSEVKTGGARTIPIDGGPGVTHEYFECFEDFLPQAGITFWYYDQLGSGFSDQPDDTSLWTVDRFREEVEQVRAALGLENFILYGHSWGGMLGIEYALKYQRHLKALVVSDMTASIASYMAYANE